jgi:hypothetical protein
VRALTEQKHVSQSLFIGQSGFKGSFVKYAEKLKLLEVLAEPHRLPKLKALAEQRKQAPEGFQFSVVLAPGALLENGRALLDYGLEVSRTLGAHWVIVRTPPSVRPGSSSERLLEGIFEQVRTRAQVNRIGWEPRGLWEGKACRRLAEGWGVHLVSDVHEVEPANVVYARLLKVGTGARTSARVLEKLALALVQCEAGYVVVDGGPALPIRRQLEEILSEAMDAEDEDDSDEFEGLDVADSDEDDAGEDDAGEDDADEDDADEDDAGEDDAEEDDAEEDDADEDETDSDTPVAPRRGGGRGRR